MAVKNIVICSDGTGNTVVKNRGSNVFKLFEAVDLNSDRDRALGALVSDDAGASDRPRIDQVTIYDDGVGTSSIRFLRILGGAMGVGLKRNVKALYADLCRIYEPGDRIFLFGFSRGAFTVRTLAGMVADCGILNADALANPRAYGQDEVCSRSDGRALPWWEALVERMPWVDSDDPERRLHVAVEDAYETHRRNYASLLSRILDAFAAMSAPPMCPECGRRTFYCRHATALRTETPNGGGSDESEAIARVGTEGLSDEEMQVYVGGSISEGGGDIPANAGRRLGVNSRLPQRGLITFVGVWDSVDAVGVPFDWLSALINRVIYRYTFPDLDAPKAVTRACHALSIDDERQTFHPLLWDESGEARSGATGASGQHGDDAAAYGSVVPDHPELDDGLIQVWFPGVHSNVGGGYVKQGMSLVALDWMMGQAEAYGLRFIDDIRAQYRALRNEYDMLYDSRAGLAVYYRYLPRNIDWLCGTDLGKEGSTTGDRRSLYHRIFGHVRPCISPIRLHASVFHRIAQGTGDYSPGNLPREFEIEGLPNRSAARVSGAIRDAYWRRLEETGSALIDMRRLAISTRRGAYYLFVVGSIFTLLYSLPSGVRQHLPSTRTVTSMGEVWPFINAWIDGLPAAFAAIPSAEVEASLPNMFLAVADAWWREPFVFFVMVVAVAGAIAARGARARALRKFWAPLRTELRRILNSA